MNCNRFAGIACIVGGVAFFGDLVLHLFGRLGRYYFVLAALMARKPTLHEHYRKRARVWSLRDAAVCRPATK